MKTSGIYQITNKMNGKFYIGSSRDIDKRWLKHIYMLKKRIHPNQHLQNAAIKYGLEIFDISIIEQTNDLLNRENHFINKLGPEYNIAVTARGGDTFSNNPKKTAIARKISIANKRAWANRTKHARDRIINNLKKFNFTRVRKLSQYKCRIVVISEKKFISLSEASRQLNIPISTLQYRIKHFDGYSYADPSSDSPLSDISHL